MIGQDHNTKKISLLLLLIGAVAVFCALFWLLRTGKLFGPETPKANWQTKEITTDTGIQATLKDKTLQLRVDGDTIFTSPQGLLVQDFLFSDIDRDGRQELLVLLWRVGRYGTAHPFWVTEEEDFYSQHLFIYNIKPDLTVKEKWCASDVGPEINRMKTMEQDEATILTEATDGECTLWRWDDWGMKSIDNKVKFVAFGDNIIHDEIRSIADTQYDGTYDFLYEPFLDEIESADIAAIQLESVLVNKEELVSGFPSFGAPMAVGEAISDAGFDIAVCANNHILDKGVDGIMATTDFFAKKNITTVGIQSPVDSVIRPYDIRYANGIKLALFSYTYGTNPGDSSISFPGMIHYLPADDDEEGKEELLQDMAKARQEADIIIVFVHWGNEYETEVSDKQTAAANLFAQGGADVVIGTHPHVVQEMNVIPKPNGGDMIVFYSLGNFRAHQGQSPETKSGAEAVLYIEHCYEGVRITDYQMLELSSYVG